MEINRGKHVFKLGFWSSIIFALTGVLYGISMGVLVGKYSIPKYITLDQFLSKVDSRFIDLYTYSQLFAFISTLFYIIMLCCIHETVIENAKIYSRISLSFGIAFTLLACINYFIQFSMVRLSIHDGIRQGLDNFVQFNPNSFSFAINMLGWSLFLGLSTLFLSFIYKGRGINAFIKISYLATCIFCLIGFIGFILDNQVFMFIFQMGMTFGLTIGAIFTALAFFKTNQRGIKNSILQ